MKLLFSFLFFSFLSFASSFSVEHKWEEICRDYEQDELQVSPQNKFILELFWQSFEKTLPAFTKNGNCAKNLFIERFENLSTTLPPAELEALSVMPLNFSWESVPKVMQLFRLKDPKGITLPIQNPFLNYLTGGRLQPITEFAPMNCHGAAEYLAGSFLKETELTSIKDWSINSKSECFSTVEEKWKNTKEHTVESLNPLGGIIINMRYSSCSASDCGLASEMIRSCEGGTPQTFTLVEGMCIDCWKKKLEEAGYQRASSVQLQEGCILTQNDHSITILKRTNEWCYYFESTTSFGAPLFRVAPCKELSLLFPYRYCRD